MTDPAAACCSAQLDLDGAAINEQLDAGDVAGIVRSEEDGCFRNLLWSTNATQRNTRGKVCVDSSLLILIVRQATQSGCIDRTGASTLTRIFRSLRSLVQPRANERTAALLAEYTLKFGVPCTETMEAFSTMAPPSGIKGSAFCTVKRTPFTFVSNVWSYCSSVI